MSAEFQWPFWTHKAAADMVAHATNYSLVLAAPPNVVASTTHLTAVLRTIRFQAYQAVAAALPAILRWSYTNKAVLDGDPDETTVKEIARVFSNGPGYLGGSAVFELHLHNLVCVAPAGSNPGADGLNKFITAAKLEILVPVDTTRQDIYVDGYFETMQRPELLSK